MKYLLVSYFLALFIHANEWDVHQGEHQISFRNSDSSGSLRSVTVHRENESTVACTLEGTNSLHRISIETSDAFFAREIAGFLNSEVTEIPNFLEKV